MERVIVDGEPCVRVPMKHDHGLSCHTCPLYAKVLDGTSCMNRCGTGFLFVREQAYIAILLENA